MMRMQQKGYTLIELLLYISLTAILLSASTYFFGQIIEARAKNRAIAEVDEQAAALIDYFTQSVHNATAVAVPQPASTAPTLALTVSTPALSPTVFGTDSPVLGYDSDGTADDTTDNGTINCTKFTASASGTVDTLYAYIGASVSASPNNKAQMALYSGASNPATLLATGAQNTIVPSSWSSFSIATTAVTSGTVYWLCYNGNGLTTTTNTFRSHAGTTGQHRSQTQTFGTWPASFTGTVENIAGSFYTEITVSGDTPSAEIKEGTGAAVALTDSKVQISNLSFKNLTRAGTPGIVQISFTLSRINSLNKSEFDYQKTYTTAAEVAW